MRIPKQGSKNFIDRTPPTPLHSMVEFLRRIAKQGKYSEKFQEDQLKDEDARRMEDITAPEVWKQKKREEYRKRTGHIPFDDELFPEDNRETPINQILEDLFKKSEQFWKKNERK